MNREGKEMINFYKLIKNTELFDPNMPCKECIVKPLCSIPCVSWENRINNEWQEERYKKCVDYIKERKRDEERGL